MTDFVGAAPAVFGALTDLLLSADGFWYRLTAAALQQHAGLSEAERGLVGARQVEVELADFTLMEVSARGLATLAMSAAGAQQWVATLAFFDAVGASHAGEDGQEWLDNFSEFVTTHRQELLAAPPAPQRPTPERQPPRQAFVAGVVRAAPVNPFTLPRPDVGTSHPGVSGLSRQEQINRFSQLRLEHVASAEFKLSPPEVEGIWDSIFAGAGITDDAEKWTLRGLVIEYTLHNGCSPNLFTERRFQITTTVSVPAISIFAYIAGEAGTLRRFMRGMADEAVAYLMAHPNVNPHWGQVHLGVDFDRLLAFDYADGRTDIDPVTREWLRNILEGILSRQARSNRRAPFMNSNSGPTRGSIHARQPRRYAVRREDEQDRFLQ